ncbi:putative salicylate hydroxylase [Cladophialophora carrionii]|uniref:Putative salicylate hydroxylase n=1 Tax=Cladophialophora carrionii TaxID=86049 RepID=A0A1C1CE64_9EURO|nr:putative salicylate hydroxylase [Cladophialophora carrionii]
MATRTTSSIAIIGASITGLSLALSLTQASLVDPADITVYDLRSPSAPDAANSSGVVLTPNGLNVLSALGILPRIHDQCWLSEYRTYKDEGDVTTRKVLIANESLYGFRNHRVWRRILVEELLGMVRDKGVQVQWENRFEGVLSECEAGVVFKVDGREERASMLFGADGIHSSIRRYVTPGDKGPEYTGVVGVLGHIPWESVAWPYGDYERACTIQGKPGALVLMPEDREGSVIMVAMQTKLEDRSREDWEALGRDKAFLRDFFAQSRDQWTSQTAKGIIDAVCGHEETLYMWPYMRMGVLERWFSDKTGRVIIIGDAAHALPPSSGQGVNQALEDIHALTRLLVLLKSKPQIQLKDALGFWQSLRQKRIDAVFDWAMNRTNVQRMPLAERETLVREGKVLDAKNAENFDDMRWLYQPHTDTLIDDWAEIHNR